MKKYLYFYFLAFLLCCSQTSVAQHTTQTNEQIGEQINQNYKQRHHFDAAVGLGSGFSTALSWSHLHGLGRKKKLKIGYGLRMTNYFGMSQNYKTAPADLIAAKQTEEIQFLSAQTNSVNATLNLQYSFSKRVEVGFNIDAFGFTFGGEQTAYQASGALVKASPTLGNLLLIDKNDRGSLNSEFYVRYWLSPQFAIRGGFSHLFSEYTTNTKLAYQNDRYRLITNLGFVAFTFRL